jgi:hypothetical protein
MQNPIKLFNNELISACDKHSWHNRGFPDGHFSTFSSFTYKTQSFATRWATRV